MVYNGCAKSQIYDVRDIAAVAVQALITNDGKHQGKAYDVTGSEALSFGQAAEQL